ncbi:MAG: DUF1905 domain-containing protein [Alphaproteobacteria bacterium]
MSELEIIFTARLWIYHGKGAWFFITLPKEESAQIKFFNNQRQRGWGAVRVDAQIGQTTWKTSVFPDTKAGAYLLPVKAAVRKKEKITAGDTVKVALKVFA